MKHVKFQIPIIIWISIFILLLAFLFILNITLPSHFEQEAKITLRNELRYFDDLVIIENDGEVFDSENTITYFSGNIYYFDLYEDDSLSDSNEKESNYMANVLNAESEIRSYCKTYIPTNGEIDTLQTNNGYYIFTAIKDIYTSEDNSDIGIMYINIHPIIEYTKSLNFLVFIIFLIVAGFMSLIGLRLGIKIEQLQETQRHFFQNSSHELKTPLMSIQGYAEAIEMGIGNVHSSAEIIMQESDRMTHLVEELLSISKIDANQLTLKYTSLDVREILYDCLRTIEPMRLKQNIQIVPHFTDQIIRVRLDETQISKVFMNLLTNSLSYSKHMIIVSCHSDGKKVIIQFKDDGDGIAKEDIPHIFERFYTGKKGNTGIGLALVQEIIHLHHGDVTAYNSNSGAIFEVTLPLI